MFKGILNWWHHISDPHCSSCELEKHYITETLKLLLEQERAEKFRLLGMIAPSQQSTTANDPIDINALRRSPRARMHELERQSREEAIRLQKRDQENIENIEREAGVQ